MANPLGKPMGIEINDPDAYRRLLSDLVGDSAPLQILQETPDTLHRIVAPYRDEDLRSRPVENKWSPMDILGHFVDVEWNFGIRLRFIVCENRPPITGYDQDLWVEHLQHNKQSAQTLLDWFRSLRMMNIHLYKSLSPDQMKRVGIHNERGEESIETMLTMEAGHDLFHIKQLKHYLDHFK